MCLWFFEHQLFYVKDPYIGYLLWKSYFKSVFEKNGDSLPGVHWSHVHGRFWSIKKPETTCPLQQRWENATTNLLSGWIHVQAGPSGLPHENHQALYWWVWQTTMCWYKVQSERVSVTQYQQYFNVCFLLYFVDMFQQSQKRKQIDSMDRSSCMIHVLYLRHYPAAFGDFIADLARERQHETCFSFYLSTFDFMVHENILFEYHLTCCHKIAIQH